MSKCNSKCNKNYNHKHIFGNSGEVLVNSFIKYISEDSKNWNSYGIYVPWFRGQSDNMKTPLPTMLRKEKSNKAGRYDEFWLSTTFRNRAPSFSETPDRDEIDKWLFLMQHTGIPTRLLDWTESPLSALYFAVENQVKDTNPAVWMINPAELNKISLNITYDCFPNSWVSGPAQDNIRLAFKDPAESLNAYSNATQKPIAIQATYIHPRIKAQKGCFTIHGLDSNGFEEIFNNDSSLLKNNFIKKYVIKRKDVAKIFERLKYLGITRSTIYPDIFGLAEELEDRFWSFN